MTWQFSSVVGRACLQALVVNDGLPSDVATGTWPALWLAGADSTDPVVESGALLDRSAGALLQPEPQPHASMWRRGRSSRRLRPRVHAGVRRAAAQPRHRKDRYPRPHDSPWDCSSTSRFVICARTRPRTAMTTGTGDGGRLATPARVDSSNSGGTPRFAACPGGLDTNRRLGLTQ